jgi:hypothetical protein
MKLHVLSKFKFANDHFKVFPQTLIFKACCSRFVGLLVAVQEANDAGLVAFLEGFDCGREGRSVIEMHLYHYLLIF